MKLLKINDRKLCARMHGRRRTQYTHEWKSYGAPPRACFSTMQILNQYLGIGEPLGVWNPDPVLDKKILKYTPCLRKNPQFYYPV